MVLALAAFAGALLVAGAYNAITTIDRKRTRQEAVLRTALQREAQKGLASARDYVPPRNRRVH